MQGVPLAVFPIAHAIFGRFARHEVVTTVTDDFVGLLTIREFLDFLARLVIDVAFAREQQNRAFLPRLDGVNRVVVLT